MRRRDLASLAIAAACGLPRAHAVDPTWLKRNASSIAAKADILPPGSSAAAYRPFFGAGDSFASVPKSVARYGELTLQPGGKTGATRYAKEEQIAYVLEGEGTVRCDGELAPLLPDDFFYLPPGAEYSLHAAPERTLRLLLMGFRIPAYAPVPHATRLMHANSNDVPLQVLPSHGPTTQFKLLMGTTESKRDKLAAASRMVSLFLMDFAPGGTNIPHHHPTEEEIYYVLRGSGEMVAGGGMDGTEGRHPTQQGDAWFLRLNTTVGFYSAAKPGEAHDLVLAVRSSYPFPPRMR